MKPKLSLLLVLLTAVLVFFTMRTDKSEKIVITGSSTVAPLLSEIAQRFEQENPDIRIDVQTGGSSRGLTDAREGVAHFGMVSRAPKSHETQDLNWHLLARDGISLILHKDNPISALTSRQVREIYRGNIKNWQDVGGLDAPIKVINKADGRSTLEVFLEAFQMQSSEIKAHVIIGDNQHGVKAVLGDPHAIGYVSIGAVENEIAQGRPLKKVQLDGTPASIENVANGSFPVARELNLVTSGAVGPLQQRFLIYAKSDAVQDLVKGKHFVSVY